MVVVPYDVVKGYFVASYNQRHVYNMYLLQRSYAEAFFQLTLMANFPFNLHNHCTLILCIIVNFIKNKPYASSDPSPGEFLGEKFSLSNNISIINTYKD